MKSESIISGFSSTGIYPVDRTKYPINRLNTIKLQAYEKWKKTGEEINWDDVIEGIVGNEVQQPGPSTAPQNNPASQPNSPTADLSCENQTQSTPLAKPVSWQDMTVVKKLSDVLGPHPCVAPQGYYWKAVWTLAPESELDLDRSFEERFLNRVNNARKKEKRPKARAKINFNSKVISHPEMLQKLTEMDEKKKIIEERKEAARLRKIEKELENRKKKTEEESEDSDEEDIEEESEEEVVDEDENMSSENNEDTDEDTNDPLASMKKCWKNINPPKKETEIVGNWFACIFTGKRSANLFIGKASRRFLSDEERNGGFAAALEVDCLQQKYDTANNILKENGVGKKDVGNVPVCDIISGPLQAIYRENGKWEFPNYLAVKHRFEAMKKLHREKLYNCFICSYFNK